MISLKSYICPSCKQSPTINCKKFCSFKILNNNIPSFTKQKTSKITTYEVRQANIFYKNFLNWLFKTFKTNEKEFRKKLFQDIKLKKNQKILITGVGNGDDLKFIFHNFKKIKLKIYAQDLSYIFLVNC